MLAPAISLIASLLSLLNLFHLFYLPPTGKIFPLLSSKQHTNSFVVSYETLGLGWIGPILYNNPENYPAVSSPRGLPICCEKMFGEWIKIWGDEKVQDWRARDTLTFLQSRKICFYWAPQVQHFHSLFNSAKFKNWSMWDWRKKLYASPKCCINSSVLPRKRKITNSFPPSSHLATLHECLRLSPPVRKKKTSQLCIVFKILIQSPKVTQMCSVLLSSHWRDLGFLKVLGSKSDSVTDTSDYKQPTAGYCWRWVT